jgi:hypothetical protein
MKDVVRKKLGISASAPIYLSQLRDGKLVDLEDGIFATSWVAVSPAYFLFRR